MSSCPLTGVTVVENASYISGRFAEVVRDPHVLEARLFRQVAGPAGERFLVPRGAIAYAGDLRACAMEVPALGG